jgi:RNA polymerase sigma-70 factor, ECF subfamily
VHALTPLSLPAAHREGVGWVDPLVERARDGDVAAFEQLAERHLPHVYRLALGVVGPDDARDVAQEAMVAAWRMLPSLRETTRFESWLHSIVMNRARNALRGRRRRPTVVLDDDHQSRFVDEPISDVHLRMDLEATFGHLSPEVRAVFVLHYVLDQPLREVARVLGVREGTVKSRLNAGLTVLRRRAQEGSL